VGIPFALAVVVPPILLRGPDRGVIRYRFLPLRWRRADVVYSLVSLPLAWLVLKGYWAVNPGLYRNWDLPAAFDEGEVRRLFLGINLVGVWDELFFVNTVFATLRSLFSFRVANTLQAVVYTAVLHDMAFTGVGPLVVFAFAWTQGAMFEKSEGLLWVLLVHLVVDFVLVAAIVGSYYPGVGFDYLWSHGM
jgi:membrane protease YdiL (CAAX protease family)